jgi:AraC-like DNA-binding protein
MPGFVRAWALRGLPELVDRSGGDGAAMLRRHGVSPRALDSPDLVLPGRIVDLLLSEACGYDADVPLRLVARQDVQVLGALAAVIETAPTVRVAVESASRFLFVFASNASVAVAPDPEGAADSAALVVQLSTTFADERIAADTGLGFLHRVLSTWSARQHYRPLGVHLPYPDAGSAYAREFFGAPLTFDAEAAIIRVDSSLLDQPVSSNARLHRQTEAMLDRLYPGRPATIVASMRDLVQASLDGAPPTLASLARLTGQHPRTIQRHLAAHGTTFEDILDDVRRTRARRLLIDTELSMAAIATALGYAEPSSFTRACHRWFDRSPQQVRRR